MTSQGSSNNTVPMHKIVVVGGGGVGKSAITIQFIQVNSALKWHILYFQKFHFFFLFPAVQPCVVRARAGLRPGDCGDDYVVCFDVNYAEIHSLSSPIFIFIPDSSVVHRSEITTVLFHSCQISIWFNCRIPHHSSVWNRWSATTATMSKHIEFRNTTWTLSNDSQRSANIVGIVGSLASLAGCQRSWRHSLRFCEILPKYIKIRIRISP